MKRQTVTTFALTLTTTTEDCIVGDCLEVFVRGKWKPTRMEYGDNWYLVGVRASDLNGLRVRI